jgi:hypothetical protein
MSVLPRGARLVSAGTHPGTGTGQGRVHRWLPQSGRLSRIRPCHLPIAGEHLPAGTTGLTAGQQPLREPRLSGRGSRVLQRHPVGGVVQHGLLRVVQGHV